MVCENILTIPQFIIQLYLTAISLGFCFCPLRISSHCPVVDYADCPTGSERMPAVGGLNLNGAADV
jgi:hypothetical protein